MSHHEIYRRSKIVDNNETYTVLLLFSCHGWHREVAPRPLPWVALIASHIIHMRPVFIISTTSSTEQQHCLHQNRLCIRSVWVFSFLRLTDIWKKKGRILGPYCRWHLCWFRRARHERIECVAAGRKGPVARGWQRPLPATGACSMMNLTLIHDCVRVSVCASVNWIDSLSFAVYDLPRT